MKPPNVAFSAMETGRGSAFRADDAVPRGGSSATTCLQSHAIDSDCCSSSSSSVEDSKPSPGSIRKGEAPGTIRSQCCQSPPRHGLVPLPPVSDVPEKHHRSFRVVGKTNFPPSCAKVYPEQAKIEPSSRICTAKAFKQPGRLSDSKCPARLRILTTLPLLLIGSTQTQPKSNTYPLSHRLSLPGSCSACASWAASGQPNHHVVAMPESLQERLLKRAPERWLTGAEPHGFVVGRSAQASHLGACRF